MTEQIPLPRTCQACGKPLPPGSHGLKRCCFSCKGSRRRAKATRLQRAWRARHPHQQERQQDP